MQISEPASCSIVVSDVVSGHDDAWKRRYHIADDCWDRPIQHVRSTEYVMFDCLLKRLGYEKQLAGTVSASIAHQFLTLPHFPMYLSALAQALKL